MKFSLGVLCVISLIFGGFAEKVRYDNYKILNLQIKTLEQSEFIKELKSLSSVSVGFTKERRRVILSILVQLLENHQAQ